MSVKVTYKGEEILSLNTDTEKALATEGQYCESDIIVENTQDGGITPSGSITLTSENTYDVTDKASAVVDFSATRADLAEAVTAKGVDTLPTSSFDTIANNIGLIEGGGGGLPSSISKIDGGSFTPASNTKCNNYNIQHNLGEMPKGAIIWCPALMDVESTSINYGLVYAFLSFLQIATSAGGYTYGFNHFYRRATTVGTSLRELTFSSETSRNASATSTTIKHNMDDNYYFAGVEYKWIAWA